MLPAGQQPARGQEHCPLHGFRRWFHQAELVQCPPAGTHGPVLSLGKSPLKATGRLCLHLPGELHSNWGRVQTWSNN